jgi:DNA modification methylase
MSYKLIFDDVREGLSSLPEKTIHSSITSPPYYKMRDYGFSKQIGLEKTPEEYIQKLVGVFSLLRKALRDDGTLWVNLGDTYASKPYDLIKPNDLIGIPWMFAFAMRADGWYLRSDIIWAKPNPLPGGVSDRPISSHEYFFLFSKKEDYYYDTEATKENATEMNKDGTFKKRLKRDVWNVPIASYKGAHFAVFPPKLIEPCILASTSDYGCCKECGASYVRRIEKHRYATRPGLNNKIDNTGFANRDSGRHLTETRTIGWDKACSCKTEERNQCVILDPFCGSGTTGVVAMQNQRDFIGIEGKKEYVKLAEQRLSSFGTILS